MHHMRYKSLRLRSLNHLRQYRDDFDVVIRELEAEPIRAIDIAEAFDGSPELVHELIEEQEPVSRGRIERTEEIYCSHNHCDECPHGPFIFSYPTGGTGQVKFKGFPFVSMKDVRWAMESGDQAGLYNRLSDQ